MKCPYINPTVSQCEQCPFPDCVNDDISVDEMKVSNERDKNADVELSDDPRIRWAQLNPERNRKNKHNHYIKNKDRYQKQRKEYHSAHSEELKEKRKEYYQKNIEYRRAWQREYVRKKRERQAG
jgi:hypothetical protein